MTQEKTAIQLVKASLQISADSNFYKILQLRERSRSWYFLTMPVVMKGNLQTGRQWFQDTTFTHFFIPTLFTLLILILIYTRMQRVTVIREKKQLVEQNIELKSLNDKKDKMISIISHEVNTSLATFYDLTEMLDPDDNTIDKSERKKLHQCLQMISRDTYLLFSNLITWSEIQLSVVNVKKEYFNLENAVEKIFNNFRYKAEKNDLTFRFSHNKEQNPVVYGDKLAVELILLNLLSIAVRNTLPEKTIAVFYKNVPDFWEIEVLSCGMHIPEEMMPDLFDHQRPHLSFGVHNDKGLKLGLYLVKELVKGFGGSVGIISNTGNTTGNKFTFSIPKPVEKT